MLAKDAMNLADILIGLEDAKQELLAEYRKAVETDVLSEELVESAARWQDLADQLDLVGLDTEGKSL